MFSEEEFDTLEAQKTEIAVQKMNARARLTALAWEMLAIEKEQKRLDERLAEIYHRQGEMIELESRALAELDLFTGVEGEVAVASDLGFSSLGLSFLGNDSVGSSGM